jgi:hypothetical protein
MQHKIVTKQKLLNESGSLLNPGYALKPLFDYSRKDIKASKWRIKEWDYYAILNNDFGLSLTIADLGYSFLISAVFFDFKNAACFKKTKIGWFSFGKMNMPSTSEFGNIAYHDKVFDFDFYRFENHRRLLCQVKNFQTGKELSADITLRDLKDDSMIIATPWKENPKAFYYNQKINCLPCSGIIKIGDNEYQFDDETSYGVLDWGRGVWTYKNTWFWGSASGNYNGKRFGFNIGYGFGDTSKATENMIFYDGIAHKLNNITFIVDQTDYQKPWRFTSDDQRFEMTMVPIIDRQDNTNFLIIKNIGHQVFGKFYGFVILDDGTKLEINNLLGFAEQITNHY